MTQQPFDPMDKLLREALESDALPPADLTDRIMAQVAATPQNAARRKKNPYWKWMVSAAACLVVAAAAIPLALNSRSRQDAMSDMATPDAAVDDSREEDMVTSAVPGSDTCDAPARPPSRTAPTTSPTTPWTPHWTTPPGCSISRATCWR